jgi:hypothetical protein
VCATDEGTRGQTGEWGEARISPNISRHCFEWREESKTSPAHTTVFVVTLLLKNRHCNF